MENELHKDYNEEKRFILHSKIWILLSFFLQTQKSSDNMIVSLGGRPVGCC